ncbi:MAG: HAMP domain-containing protein [Inquilinus sp.]|nr:HAMP domain-containing protein [Inquilinus sp.]
MSSTKPADSKSDRSAARGGGKRSFLANLKIGTKIYAGFGLIIGLLVLLTALVVLEIEGLRRNFFDYADMASDALLVAELDADIADLQLNAREYQLIGSEEDLAHTREAYDQVRAGLAHAEEEIHNPLRARLVTEIDTLVDEYREGFDQVVELMHERDRVVYEVLNPLGTSLRERLTEINEGAYAAGDYESANYAGVVQSDLLLARLYVTKFLDTNDLSAIERVRDEFEELERALARLDRSLQNPQRRRVLVSFEEDLPKYEAAFEQVAEIIGRRNEIRVTVLDRIGAEIGHKIEEVKVSAHDDENALEAATIAAVEAAEVEDVIIAGTTLVIGIVVAFTTGRSIARPVLGLSAAMRKLADGDKSIEVPGVGRKDEVGVMADTVEVFKQNAIRMDELSANQARQDERAAEEKREAMRKLADDFDSRVKDVVQSVSSSATQMEASAKMLAGGAEQTSMRSSTVAAASEEASTNVQTVASATEELSASSAEIGQRVEQSAEMTARAVSESEAASRTVQGLAEAAQKIGDVVSLINDIAGQTNLLALNATIEAARAGEAGKGFAGVASEVKSLAGQTAKATEEISAQITSIQAESSNTVSAIEAIRGAISEVSQVASAIASAVEEQSSATREISRNVQQASSGTREVSSNIAEVSAAARETGEGADQVLKASGTVAEQADRLRTEMEKFLNEIRAA